MSSVQCEVGGKQVHLQLKLEPRVTLSGLQSLCCIRIFLQTELAAQQLPLQIWAVQAVLTFCVE